MGKPTRTRYEKLIARGVDRAYSANLAHAAYAARAAGIHADQHSATVWDIGANVAGPFLFAYVLWVVLHANSNGKRRLYFLARDGEILRAIAARIVAKCNVDIDCRYLLASRQAWHLPSIIAIDDYAREWIFGEPPFAAITQVFSRLELDPVEFQTVLTELGFPRAGWSLPLGRPERDCLFNAFHSKPLAPAIAARSAERRTATLAFLRDRGLFDGTPAAIVDVGWNGRLQTSLARLFIAADETSSLPTGYYVGLNRILAAAEAGPNHVFISLPSNLNAVVIESLCAALHGSVRGFRIDSNGCAVADLRTPNNAAALMWGLQTFQDAVLSFVDHALATAPTFDFGRLQLATLATGMGVLDRFTHWPTRAEADCFGRFPHSELQEHLISSEVGPPFNVLGKLREVASRRKRRSPYYWVEGSVRRSFPSIALSVYRLWRLLVDRRHCFNMRREVTRSDNLPAENLRRNEAC